ncbi:HTH domain-containing protein, partial [Microvirga sp. 3-52]|nr:HTH domain-containing protein [Microvirga sp. 3-52]
MTSSEKILGSDRRNLLVKLLKEASTPIPGRELGEITNVSRQVISSDITLLKAKGQ